VVPRYERFLERFGDEVALAAAAPAEVLAEWSGLGYNRRAINLRRAAAHVVEHGWPQTADRLVELPGVGPYTAAAVACFAFGEPVAAVDTNLRRVLSRWYGEPLDGKDLIGRADEALDAQRPAEWNQAVMDLGATVCAPRRPACDRCPVEQWCQDPDVYTPPKPQGRFEGSNRQVRGAIVRALVEADALAITDLSQAIDIDETRVAVATTALIRDGVVVEVAGMVSLPTVGSHDGVG
jgi:A/G-specific adenine glycosylase